MKGRSPRNRRTLPSESVTGEILGESCLAVPPRRRGASIFADNGERGEACSQLRQYAVQSHLPCGGLSKRMPAWNSLAEFSELEQLRGVGLLPKGRRGSSLADAIEANLAGDFAGRVLPIDSVADVALAEMFVERIAAGHPISFTDCQIASVARVFGATIATWNAADFERCSIGMINPWKHEWTPDTDVR